MTSRYLQPLHRVRGFLWAIAVAGGLSLFAASAHSATTTIAVAANFKPVMDEIVPVFEKRSGHSVHVVYGTVTKLAKQIEQGAPFDVLISSDQHTVDTLQGTGLTVPETRFCYAIGELVLWSANPGLVDPQAEVLKKGDFRRLAIANPKVAIYGRAAQQVLEKLGLWTAMQPKIVLGENITQAHQFVATGNAELGFVAKSQVFKDQWVGGSHWVIPQSLYQLLKQDAVLLKRGQDNPAARAFLQQLMAPATQPVLLRYGYDACDKSS